MADSGLRVVSGSNQEGELGSTDARAVGTEESKIHVASAYSSSKPWGRSFSNLMGLLGDATEHGGSARTASVLPSSAKREWSIPPWIRKRITFYRLHFAAFFIITLVGTFVIWLTPGGPEGPISFIDAMFLVTSAFCVTGLITVKLAVLSSFDKVFLIFLMFLGSQVFTSLVPVYVRRYFFRKYLQRQAEAELARDDSLQSTGSDVRDAAGAPVPPLVPLSGVPDSDGVSKQGREQGGVEGEDEDICTLGDSRPGSGEGEGEIQREYGTKPVFSAIEADDPSSHSASERRGNPGVNPTLERPRGRLSSSPWRIWGFGRTVSPEEDKKEESVSQAATPMAGTPGAYQRQRSFEREADDERITQTWAGDTAKENAARLKAMLDSGGRSMNLSRSARFSAPDDPHLVKNLSRLNTFSLKADGSVDNAKLLPAEKRYVELRALELLSWLVPVYMLGSILLAFALLSIVLWCSPYYRTLLDNAGVNPFFMAIFQSVSAFANAGLSLFDDNLIQFQSGVAYLLIVAILILVGNTMYAPTLRGILYAIFYFGRDEDMRLVAKYLVDHPRRCYTHLFPAGATRWLVVSVLLFNLTEFVFFCALDWNSLALDGLPSSTKVLDGVFQSISTRNAGFNVISISLLSPAMLFLYVGMMYVAVYPVFITRQRSREQREVYDDEDIGLFYEDLEEGVMDETVLGQGRKLVGQDSVLIFLAIFIICIIQAGQLENDPNFSIFNVTFEVISAYGNVGLSLGYACVPPPGATCDSPPYSFSGVWYTGSKLILIFVMFLGRHRGLPDNIDAAITIPDVKHFTVTQKQPVQDGTELLMSIPSLPTSTLRSQPSLILRRMTSVKMDMDVRTRSGSNVP